MTDDQDLDFAAPVAPAVPDPCPACRPGTVCRTPKCGRVKLAAAPPPTPAAAVPDACPHGTPHRWPCDACDSPAAVPSAEPLAYKIYHPANPNCFYLSTELPSPTRSDTGEADEYFGGKAVPLYAAPQPAAVPLTDEQIDALMPEADGSAEANSTRVEVQPGIWGREYDDVDAWSLPLVRQIARAIEAAHGIGAAREPETIHCAEKRKPGGCQLHNLHCGWPACNKGTT